MKVGKIMRRCLGATAIGLLAMMMPVEPAQADAGYVQLNVGTTSPQYSVNGCRYKIVYGTYVGTPYAGVHLYGGCTSVSVGVRSADSSGIHWTWSSTVSHTGTDSCGAFTAVQANGPNPGYGTAAGIIGNGTFWKFYDGDGDQTQSIHSTC